jgi:GNAT superfamily N-acetyltransferase
VEPHQPPVAVRPLGQPGDLGWVVMAHGEVYAAEFGWSTRFEAVIAGIVADYAAREDPVRQAGWIAELDGERVGCVLCVPTDHATARLRTLLVYPRARGRGLGGRLVDTCVGFARGAGYTRLRLWTDDILLAARRLYLDRGFRLVHEERHRTFGVDLTGQVYQLDLTS